MREYDFVERRRNQCRDQNDTWPCKHADYYDIFYDMNEEKLLI